MFKLNRYMIPISIILASCILGGFYYISEARKEQHATERQQQKTDKAAFLLSNCTGLAKEALTEQWHDACSALSLLSGECRSIKDMTLEEYARANHLNPNDFETPAKWGEYSVEVLAKKEKCACRLPPAIADRLNKTAKDRKDECYKKYPQE